MEQDDSPRNHDALQDARAEHASTVRGRAEIQAQLAAAANPPHPDHQLVAALDSALARGADIRARNKALAEHARDTPQRDDTRTEAGDPSPAARQIVDIARSDRYRACSRFYFDANGNLVEALMGPFAFAPDPSTYAIQVDRHMTASEVQGALDRHAAATPPTTITR